MKKFGTPSGAGPGNANEKVGFAAVGTPFAARGGWGFATAPVCVLVTMRVERPAPGLAAGRLLWRDGRWVLPGPLGFGGELELVLVVLVDVVVVVAEVVVEEQDSVTDATPTLTGSEIEERGVPGGTSTLKVKVCPSVVLTVITHVSADATGIAAIAMTASTAPAIATATKSFRLLNKVA
jgi:hypothetical protein